MTDGTFKAVLTICVSVVLSVGVVKYLPGLRPAPANVVVLDVVRLNNAFRAAASPLISQSEEGREITAAELAVTGKRTLEVVRSVAGGNLVLLKQATVGSTDLQDITGDVIAELGLTDASATPLPDLDATAAAVARLRASPSKDATGEKKWQENVLP